MHAKTCRLSKLEEFRESSFFEALFISSTRSAVISITANFEYLLLLFADIHVVVDLLHHKILILVIGFKLLFRRKENSTVDHS